MQPIIAGSAGHLVTQAMRSIDIKQVLVGAGTAGSLGVGAVELGEATIDRLVLEGLSAGVHTGNAYLENVRFVLELQLSVDWWYDLKLWSDHGTQNLGSISFGLGIGNVLVPALQDINLTVPQATVTGVKAQVTPLANLDLGGASFRGVEVDDVKLPSAGFGISGLQLNSLTVDQVGVPAADARKITLAEFTPAGPLRLPAAEVTGIQVPSLQIPNAASSGPVNIDDARVTRRGVALDLGVLGFTFWVQPIIDIHIGKLTLGNLSLSAGVDRLRIENLSAPVTVRDIAVGDLQLQQVTVNHISL